mgnify:FL=1
MNIKKLELKSLLERTKILVPLLGAKKKQMIQIKCRKGHVNEFTKADLEIHLKTPIGKCEPLICKGTFLEPVNCGRLLIREIVNWKQNEKR